MNTLVKNILFGNYFYGFCVIALSVEAALQQKITIANPLYYALIFFCTVYYYSKAYTHLNDPKSSNPRTNWYFKNAANIRITQRVYFILILIIASVYIIPLVKYPIPNTLYLLFVFPLTALLYYGLSSKGISKYNLRSIGWLKPLIIGFTWAGVVTVYPVLFYMLESGNTYEFGPVNVLLFIKNVMFVLTLSIMFDIKDYASDYNKEIKTFVVEYGLRKTIFYILFPLSVIGFFSFIAFALIRDFSPVRIFFNTIPFMGLLALCYSMKKRRNILYYLFIIDGLLLLKGICGSVAMLIG